MFLFAGFWSGSPCQVRVEEVKASLIIELNEDRLLRARLVLAVPGCREGLHLVVWWCWWRWS